MLGKKTWQTNQQIFKQKSNHRFSESLRCIHIYEQLKYPVFAVSTVSYDCQISYSKYLFCSYSLWDLAQFSLSHGKGDRNTRNTQWYLITYCWKRFYTNKCFLALSYMGSLFINWIASAVFCKMNDENINLAMSIVLCDMLAAGQGSWEPSWPSNGESESSVGAMWISLRIQFNTQRSEHVVLFQFHSAI